MNVSSIRLQNYRSFVDSGTIKLEQINVIIGRNNAGKSSILRGLHLLQAGPNEVFADVRAGSNQALIDMELTDIKGGWGWRSTFEGIGATCSITLNSSDRIGGAIGGHITNPLRGQLSFQQIPAAEPMHVVLPFLSKRKPSSYIEDVRDSNVREISPDFRTLAAKLQRLSNPNFPRYKYYSEACKEILGFVVTAVPSLNGLRPGIYLPNGDTVFIDQMGEGVANVVYLLTALATSEGKIFLLEEPENDLHPAALKALLELVVSSSPSNQFVVSTHSNIVVRHLCSAPDSRLLRVTADALVLPTTARVEVVPPTPEARIAVLQDLGYSFEDFDLWDGWLILEESSAEKIIRDFLIPWFVPELRRVRTLAAGGVSKVSPLFEDLNRLVLFTHLMPAYSGKTWVRVDGDEAGLELTRKLRLSFPTWAEDRFAVFDNEQFERFFPQVFAGRSDAALKTVGKQELRAAKKELLSDVVKWLDEDEKRGKAALMETAKSVIDDLKRIAQQLEAS